jgi:hypothetical protein
MVNNGSSKLRMDSDDNEMLVSKNNYGESMCLSKNRCQLAVSSTC